MRKVKIKGRWIVDIMFFERDSYHLHLFALVIYKGIRCIVRTTDLRIPMKIKPMRINSERNPGEGAGQSR